MKATVAVIAVIGVAALTVLAGVQALRVVSRLLAAQRKGAERWNARRASLEDDRRRSLHNLREVQFDYDTGKIDEADYLALKARYEQRAVAAMRALDSEGHS